MQIGLEKFLNKPSKKWKGLRLGVLCNQASNDSQLRHISDRVLEKKYGLTVSCFFGPQHGIRGEKQDNMVESQDFVDARLKLPVFSLYSDHREPTDAMLSKLDAFVVDLQDIGTRIYTFMYTLAYCMRGAKRTGKKVIVLDRPNPIGGAAIEGNLLESSFTSFVGLFPMVVRHGMTMGELARMFNEEFGIGCDLEVIPVTGWKRGSYADQWKREWVPPSPNIPSYQSALVFPGTVLFEGTNVSEGRGTTRPFEWIGAPYIDPDKLADQMNRQRLPGVYFRPIFFQPTFHKGKDQVCGGVHVHVTDRNKFNSFRAGYRLLLAIAETYPKQFQWKQPPYEYEHDRLPIDLIAGTDKLRKMVGSPTLQKEWENQLRHDVTQFRKIRNRYLLY